MLMPLRKLIAFAAFAACCGCTQSSTMVGTSDPSVVMHLAESSKVPIPVACRVKPNAASANAIVEATLKNTAKKTIIGADLTVVDGAATSAFVPLSIAAGSTSIVHRTLPLTAPPSARATCTLTMLQYADKSGWQYAPQVR